MRWVLHGDLAVGHARKCASSRSSGRKPSRGRRARRHGCDHLPISRGTQVQPQKRDSRTCRRSVIVHEDRSRPLTTAPVRSAPLRQSPAVAKYRKLLYILCHIYEGLAAKIGQLLVVPLTHVMAAHGCAHDDTPSAPHLAPERVRVRPQLPRSLQTASGGISVGEV